MHFLDMILVAIGLGCDTFSVALGIGTAREHRPGQELRLAGSFGLFQGCMPVIGWVLGANVVSLISAWDHWIAFSILTAVAAKMIYEACRGHREHRQEDPTRGRTLLLLSVATSIDALGVGLVMGIRSADIAIPCAIIAMVAFAMTYVGYHFGRVLSRGFGRVAEIFGGLVLLIIAIRMLWM